MHKLFTLILLLLCFVSPSFSQSSFSGNESVWEQDYFSVQHINDLDFLFYQGNNGRTNDHAFTSSFLLKGFINQRESKNRLLSFELQTDLYTQSEGSWKFDEDDRYYVGEYFTEISYAEFNAVQFVNKNWAFKWGGGAGILNKKKPITGLALWMQGGNDGAGGIHKLLDNLGKNHGQINVSRDTLSPFVYINPAVNYFLSTKQRGNKLPHTFVSEFGANLCTNFNAVWLFWENDIRVHLWQFKFLNKPFDIQLIGQGDLKIHKDGRCLDARFGGEISVGKLSVGYEQTKMYGDPNIAWYDFSDDEDLFRFFLKVRLNEKKYQNNYLVSR